VAAAGCLAREPFRFRSFPLLTQTNLALAVSSGRVVGYTEVIQDGHRADQYPGSRPVFRNSDRASTPGYRDPGAFKGSNDRLSRVDACKDEGHSDASSIKRVTSS